MNELLLIFTAPEYTFLRVAMFVGTVAGVSFGTVGTLVVTRRVTYLAGAMAHCAFAGIGAGLFAQNQLGWMWLTPMLGAAIAAVVAAAILWVVQRIGMEREDTAIGAIWALGMAVGLILIEYTPGYHQVESYLFGNILLISWEDQWLVTALSGLVVVAYVVGYPRIEAVCFDEEYAALRGVPTTWYYLLLLIITALTVVLMVRVVGIVLVIALLTLPAATATRLGSRLFPITVIAIVLSIVETWVGILTSALVGPPTGPTIILIAGAVYLGVLVFTAKRRR